MGEERPRDYSRKSEGWLSANALARSGVLGGAAAINRAMGDLRLALIRDVASSAGMLLDEATTHVNDHLLGMRQPVHGRAALHASADAVGMMERDGALRHTSEAPPPRPRDWRSANNMSRKDFVGNLATIEKKLLKLRKSLVDDIIAAGLSSSVAEWVVDQHLIGWKKPARGPESLHASPLALNLLERDGILKRRDR